MFLELWGLDSGLTDPEKGEVGAMSL